MVTNTKVVGGLHFGSYQYLSIEVVRQDGSDRQKYGDGVVVKNFVFKCRRKNTIFLAQISILTFHMVCSVLLRVLASKAIEYKLLIQKEFQPASRCFFELALATRRRTLSGRWLR